MVRALLDGSKTQTRRIMKVQPELLYRLTGDKIEVAYNSGALYGFDFPTLKRGITTDSRIAELGLHGGIGWQHLLADAIQRLREEGCSGLVSVAGSRNKKGVLECLVVPRKQEGHEVSPSLNLHGLPRNAGAKNSTDETQGRDSIKQRPDQSDMGESISELGGSGGPRERDEGRETPSIEADGCRERASSLGLQGRAVQSKASGPRSWNVPGCNVRLSQFYEGLNLWVREAWQKAGGDTGYWYRATDDKADDGESPVSCWKPSIFMPRAASRITLEIVSIRVERLNDISESDAQAEGAAPSIVGSNLEHLKYRAGYQTLWGSINGPDSWAANPWVWVVEFKRIES